MVLDSTVDPRQVWYKSNLAQDVAFQKTFSIYFSWLAKYHRIYHVGNTRAAVRKRYLCDGREARQARLQELSRRRRADRRLHRRPVTTSTAGRTIAQAYSKYMHGPVTATRCSAMYKSANSTAKGGDNEDAMYLATSVHRHRMAA